MPSFKKVKQNELNIGDDVVSINAVGTHGKISRIESGSCFVDFTKKNQKSKLTKVAIDDLRKVTQVRHKKE